MLTDLIGQEIILKVSGFSPDALSPAKLVEVDFGGIWVESQKFTDAFLHSQGQKATAKTPVFFFPYAKIEFVVSAADYPGLSETGFGIAK